MRTPLFAWIAFLNLLSINALASLTSRAASYPLPTRDIVRFPNETWLENLAVRKNSQILVTLHSAPEIYQIDPFQTDNAPCARSPYSQGNGPLRYRRGSGGRVLRHRGKCVDLANWVHPRELLGLEYGSQRR